MQIMNVNGFVHRFKTKFIRRTVNVTAAHTATGHPH